VGPVPSGRRRGAVAQHRVRRRSVSKSMMGGGGCCQQRDSCRHYTTSRSTCTLLLLVLGACYFSSSVDSQGRSTGRWTTTTATSSSSSSATSAATSAATSLQDDIEQLKRDIHLLDASQAASRLQRISLTSPPPRQAKINHVVVLFMENRPHDHFFGCMDLPGLDGIPAAGRLLPRHPAYPGHNGSAGFVNVTCGTAKYICDKPPAYSTWNSKFAPNAECVRVCVRACVRA
jgi:hypothetical protein